MIFSTVMTDFLKHFFLISRGLVELITPSQSRDLKKLTQIIYEIITISNEGY